MFCPHVPMSGALEGRRAGLAGSNSHRVLNIEDENLAVADFAGGGRGLDGLDGLGRGGVLDNRLELHLGHEIHLVLSAPVNFRLTLLPPVTLDFRNRQTLDAGRHKGFTHVVQLEGFDDRYDKFHPLAPALPRLDMRHMLFQAGAHVQLHRGGR